MFYQSQNSLSSDSIKLENGIDFNFPMHLHSSFEFIIVTEGEMVVTVDGTPYVLCCMDALLIFPNQMHKLETPEHSCHFLCIFPQNIVQAYSKTVMSKVPEDNKFRPEFSLVERLASLNDNDTVMTVKGVLYSLCGIFDQNRIYKERAGGKESLLSDIFRFVEDNYGNDCSLEALSRHTSYHYVYLSKYFKQCTGMSFTDYVNRYRVSEACYLLQNLDQTILKTAYDCGFDSLRSFNRNFKAIIGTTPSEYQSKF